MIFLKTERLILREWEDQDLDAFARINQDPKVMEHFPSTLNKEATSNLLDNFRAKQRLYGYCFWAAELKATGELIGLIGLNQVSKNLPFAPAVEIGWRLASEHWGKGYAPEGARAALDFAFNELGLDEIISFTTMGNLRSMRVMEKIGMERDKAGDFLHPGLPAEHPMAQHVLYRI